MSDNLVVITKTDPKPKAYLKKGDLFNLVYGYNFDRTITLKALIDFNIKLTK